MCAPAALAPPAGPAKAGPNEAGPAEAGSSVSFTVLHFNDVYEITPVEGGQAGGLARVAGLRQRLLAQDPQHDHGPWPATS